MFLSEIDQKFGCLVFLAKIASAVRTECQESYQKMMRAIKEQIREKEVIKSRLRSPEETRAFSFPNPIQVTPKNFFFSSTEWLGFLVKYRVALALTVAILGFLFSYICSYV